MTETAIVAILLALAAGLAAGNAWANARRGPGQRRPDFRASAHYAEGLRCLVSGQLDAAIRELDQVLADYPNSSEVQQVMAELNREVGKAERAIALHRSLLKRGDLGRGERASILASLGTDYRKAGFLDRAAQAYQEALDLEPGNLHALSGQQKLHEEQRQWQEAYEAEASLLRRRRSQDWLVAALLQTEIGREAARGGRREAAEAAFKTALSLDRRAFPAHLALAELWQEREPARAAAILEAAVAAAPERAYLALGPLGRLYTALGEPSRFEALCERLVAQDPRDWRARLALGRQLRNQGRPREALGLLQRALESNPYLLGVHLEVWRTLRALEALAPDAVSYVDSAEASALATDPHVCTACRYRAEEMLWRCPHCHEWGSFVEERIGRTPDQR